MNRKERRKAQKELKMGNKINSKPVNVLAPITPVDTLINKQIKRVMDQERVKASNDTMNLLSSIFIIVLKELQGFELEKIEEVLKQVMEQIELCGQELVTIDEMMGLAKSYGIEIHIDEKEMDKIAAWMNKKMAVFEQLDNGITEIEDLVKATGCTGREVSSFRWEYNSKKYGVVDMTKKEQIFKSLEDGLSKEQIIKKFGISKGAFDQYKYLWRKETGSATIDDLADAIFADNSVENKPEQEKRVSHEEIPIETKRTCTEPNNAEIERVEQNNQSEEIIEEKVEEEVVIMQEQVIKKRF